MIPEIIMGLLLGIFLGLLIFTFIFNPIDNFTIEEIRQYQSDCNIKEYYYIDSHRVICDKLGVTPQ